MIVRCNVSLPCNKLNSNLKPDEINLNINHCSTIEREFQEITPINNVYSGFLRSYETNEKVILCCSDTVFLVINKGGDQIDFEADIHEINLAKELIIGIALSILMIYRGYLPLHASSVLFNQKCISFMADSGVGKSTLLWSLVGNGAKLVSDDVLPTKVDVNKKTIAIPSVSLPSKLWKDSIKKFDLNLNNYKKIREGMDKYYIKVEETIRVEDKLELDMIFILNPVTETINNDGIDISPIRDISQLSLVFRNIHGGWAIPRTKYFELIKLFSCISKYTSIYRINYIRKYDTIPKLIDRLQNITL